ncbi:unnamed protein product [Gongylonema pulchrum]|uniref:CRC domain-containing protein n=1 Tax=Gongylonema pulchrum TaxID=637853 RepID=A0A183E579_9BILA|nr:unnamed protein product [Gongylonema pulchrum]
MSRPAASSHNCCDCPTAQNRCSADCCPCYGARRMCDEHCESARYRGDCLNQAICKCSCEVDPAKPAKNACSKSERCDCLRIKESCSKLCACKQICKNKEPQKKLLKCGGECTNGPSKFHVPKHVQSCFLEQKNESSGLIVTLIGDDYIYRGDFYHESRSEPHVEEQLVAAIYDLISKYKFLFTVSNRTLLLKYDQQNSCLHILKIICSFTACLLTESR